MNEMFACFPSSVGGPNCAKPYCVHVVAVGANKLVKPFHISLYTPCLLCTRTHGKFSEHPAHDLNEVLTHKETILRSIVDEKFFRSIQPYQHDHLITAAFEVYQLDNDLKEFADTCIRFIDFT
jgi:hypothetical protein